MKETTKIILGIIGVVMAVSLSRKCGLINIWQDQHLTKSKIEEPPTRSQSVVTSKS